MLIIRLQRTGSKNRPAYRLVLASAEKSASKKFIEVLGSYNPTTKLFAVKNQEKLKYWIEQNVKLSPTVHNLLVDKQYVQKAKLKVWKPKKKAKAEGDSGTEAKQEETKAQEPAQQDSNNEAAVV